MNRFQAMSGFYRGDITLVLGLDPVVYRADTESKRFIVEQFGFTSDEGQLTLVQAQHFTDAATGVKEITRILVGTSCFVRMAFA